MKCYLYIFTEFILCLHLGEQFITRLFLKCITLCDNQAQQSNLFVGMWIFDDDSLGLLMN
jgi:hypothetical protein